MARPPMARSQEGRGVQSDSTCLAWTRAGQVRGEAGAGQDPVAGAGQDPGGAAGGQDPGGTGGQDPGGQDPGGTGGQDPGGSGGQDPGGAGGAGVQEEPRRRPGGAGSD